MKKYYILHPAVFRLDGGAMFGIIPKPLWSKAIEPDELNRIQLSLRVLLIRTKNRNILIDTGIGDYHGKKFDSRFDIKGNPDPLVGLLKTGFDLEPKDITDLIISHLHFDHVGGLGADVPHRLLFPKATIHIHRKHYAYALNPTERDSGSFQVEYFKPLIEQADAQNRVHWLEDETGEILTDGAHSIHYKCSFGHTPWLVHAYDEKFIYMADLVPTLHHLPIPWVMGYDIAPGETTKDKKKFYAFIAESQKTMIFEHDVEHWGSKILWENNQPRTTEIFSTKDEKIKEIFVENVHP